MDVFQNRNTIHLGQLSIENTIMNLKAEGVRSIIQRMFNQAVIKKIITLFP